LLGVLVLAHKAMDLWSTLPRNLAVVPMWSGTCLHKWLGVVPLSAMEERQMQLTFVLSMLMVSAHVRAVLKEQRFLGSGASGVLADVPYESLQAEFVGLGLRDRFASSPLLDDQAQQSLQQLQGEQMSTLVAPHEVAAGNADLENLEDFTSQQGAARGGAVGAGSSGSAQTKQLSSDTLSAVHWKGSPTMVDREVDFDVDGDEEDASGTGAAAAAEKSWMGWTLAQGAIGSALLMIFDLFASIKGDDTLPDDEQPKQSLAPVPMLLLVLHAVVAKSCIRSVCQRLQLLLCAMLWLDAVFQVPTTLLYNAPKDPPSPPDMCNDASCSWPAACLQNATAISRAAEAAGVKIVLGSVAIAPVAAFLIVMMLIVMMLIVMMLIVMMLQLLIESQWSSVRNALARCSLSSPHHVAALDRITVVQNSRAVYCCKCLAHENARCCLVCGGASIQSARYALAPCRARAQPTPCARTATDDVYQPFQQRRRAIPTFAAYCRHPQ